MKLTQTEGDDLFLFAFDWVWDTSGYQVHVYKYSLQLLSITDNFTVAQLGTPSGISAFGYKNEYDCNKSNYMHRSVLGKEWESVHGV